MEFVVALKKVYRTSRKKEQLNNPFLVYSRVSDLIGNSYSDKKKADLFFELLKRVNMFELLAEYGENGRKKIKEKASEVKDLTSKETFCKIADIVCDTVYPPPKPVAVKEKAVKAKVEKAEAPKPKKEKRTPLDNTYQPPLNNTYQPTVNTYHGGYSSRSVWKIIGCILLVLVSIFAVGALVNGILYAIHNVPWSVWEWIIAVVGALTLFGLTIWLCAWLDSEAMLDICVSGTFVMYLFAIGNFLLNLFVTWYTFPFFICVSVPVFLIGFFLTILTFDELEERWGYAQIVALIMDAVFSVICIVQNT